MEDISQLITIVLKAFISLHFTCFTSPMSAVLFEKRRKKRSTNHLCSVAALLRDGQQRRGHFSMYSDLCMDVEK